MEPIFYDLELECKPDFVECMKRVYAWYDGDIIDRVPVRFSAHNSEFENVDTDDKWHTKKEKWYDTGYHVDRYLASLNHPFIGETFPVFWPNLGPNVFAGILGGEVEFGDVTSWTHPVLTSVDQAEKIEWNNESEYLAKLLEMTDYALFKCPNRFMVGYTDIHPSLDCLDALRGTEGLCMDMYDEPELVHKMIEKCYEPLAKAMRIFHDKLKAHKQLSVTWMNIPSYETLHIPSCDLGSMISGAHFNEFALPYIKREVQQFTHNIFHMDGKGVAKHLDAILEVGGINAVQWVQGVGTDRPIAQWIPMIKKIQSAGKGVVVDLKVSELEEFISAVKPGGIYLCIDESDKLIQESVLKRLKKWK